MGGKMKDRTLLKGKTMRPFVEAMKSESTREVYERRLVGFLDLMHMPVDEFVEKSKKEPEWAQRTLLEYMLGEKNRFLNKEIQASTTRNVLKPLRLLLEMNDVTGINWKKISRMMPSARRYALDRAPTIEEMRTMVTNGDMRFQAIILTMASSGIRIGAWEYLKVKHLEPISISGKVAAAKLTVYAGEPEEYITFVTPEANAKLQEYLKFRKEHGEKVTMDSPLVRDKWETTGTRGRPFKGEAVKPLPLRYRGVKRLFEDMMWRFGFRKEKKRRHEFSIHSIRKFFKTRCELHGMKPINVETLMGHSTGISDSYYRPTERELLEEYVKVVPLLSISEVEEIKRVVLVEEQQNAEKIRKLEDLVAQLVTAKAQQALAVDRSHKPDTGS